MLSTLLQLTTQWSLSHFACLLSKLLSSYFYNPRLIEPSVLLIIIQIQSQSMLLGHTFNFIQPLLSNACAIMSAKLGSMPGSMLSCVGRKACWGVASGQVVYTFYISVILLVCHSFSCTRRLVEEYHDWLCWIWQYVHGISHLRHYNYLLQCYQRLELHSPWHNLDF